MTINEIFDKYYNKSIEKGLSYDEAVRNAIDNIWDVYPIRKAEVDAFLVENAEYKKVFDDIDNEIKAISDNRERDNWLNTSVFKYHPAGSVFSVNFKDGTYKVKAVERKRQGVPCYPACHECAFRKPNGLAPNGSTIWGCRFSRNGHHANCVAHIITENGTVMQVREDGKDVVYKWVN